MKWKKRVTEVPVKNMKVPFTGMNFQAEIGRLVRERDEAFELCKQLAEGWKKLRSGCFDLEEAEAIRSDMDALCDKVEEANG